MKPFELAEHVLKPGNRNLVRLTMKDCEKALHQFDVLHNTKANFTAERVKLLSKMHIDIDEVDC